MATLRYREARNRADQLGQVFTPHAIANLLVRSIPSTDSEIRFIVDIGAGQGALARAALSQHTRARALLVEIDQKITRQLITTLPRRASAICTDALSGNWLQQKHPSMILSNPPYGETRMTPALHSMLKRSGLDVAHHRNWIRGDLAFVAKTWEISEIGTGIGLIVASPLIRHKSYERLRWELASKMSGLCVTQLAETTFNNTEVRSYMLTGARAISRRRNVILRKATVDGTIVDEMSVSSSLATRSLDIDFHRSIQSLGLNFGRGDETLGSIASIVRGSRSNQDFARLGLHAFHTTDFDDASPYVKLRGAAHGYHIARSGDILIPRVGTRCLVHQSKVKSGEGLFTDCVYKLVAKSKDRPRIWETLSSSFGAEWRIANASGNCAKHLTVQILASMPLIS